METIWKVHVSLYGDTCIKATVTEWEIINEGEKQITAADYTEPHVRATRRVRKVDLNKMQDQGHHCTGWATDKLAAREIIVQAVEALKVLAKAEYNSAKAQYEKTLTEPQVTIKARAVGAAG